MAKKNTSTGFEKDMHRIQEIASLLEDGQLPLDEALKLFEESNTLLRNCTQQLNEAILKFTTLNEDAG